MERPWTENFDFYEAAASKGRAMISLDLAAAEQAPLESHPVRMQFRVKMLQPRPDGLRSAEEADALFALEDRLVTAMDALDALYVGRAVAYGCSEYFFYVPAAKKDARPSLSQLAPYSLEVFAVEDADWERYFELYPSPYAVQTIMNRRLVRQLREQGDQLERPRRIDHLARFESQLQADAAATALRDAGFETGSPTRQDDGAWALEFHKVDHAAEGRPDQFVADIFHLLAPHEGDYDGWGAPVQQG